MLVGWTFLTTSFVMLMLSLKHNSEYTMDYTFQFNAHKHNESGVFLGPQYGLKLTSGLIDHSSVHWELFVNNTRTPERTSLCSGHFDHDDIINSDKPRDAAKKHGKYSQWPKFIVNVAQTSLQAGFATDHESSSYTDKEVQVNANGEIPWETVFQRRGDPAITSGIIGNARDASSAAAGKINVANLKFPITCDALRTEKFYYNNIDAGNGSATEHEYGTLSVGRVLADDVDKFSGFLTIINPGKSTSALASAVQLGLDAINYQGPKEKCDSGMIYDNVAQAQAISSDLFWYSVITFILATILGLFYILDFAKDLIEMLRGTLNKTSSYESYESKPNDESLKEATRHSSEGKIQTVVFFLISSFTTVLIGLMLMQYDNLSDSLEYQGGLASSCADHSDFDMDLERDTWFGITCTAIAFYGLVAVTSAYDAIAVYCSE